MKDLDVRRRVDNELPALEPGEFARVSSSYGYGYGFERPGNKIDLGEYWQAIRKRLWLIAITLQYHATVGLFLSENRYYMATNGVQ